MIYFIQAQTYPYLIKIGFTEAPDISIRYSHFKSMNATDICLILSFSGTLQDEQSLHCQFSDIRIKGEWFFPSKKLLKFIVNKKASLSKNNFSKIKKTINKKDNLNKLTDNLINENKRLEAFYSKKITALTETIKRLQIENKQFWLEKNNTKNMPTIKNLKKNSINFSNHCQNLLNKML